MCISRSCEVRFVCRSAHIAAQLHLVIAALLSILHKFCALLDVSFSNYEKTAPAKRTIIATAGIQNEKSGVWDRFHKWSAFYRLFVKF